tara:strand:- start:268 stop:666 length:399 start_codon:yes stop_codon:yes gene_type:complete
MKKLLACACLVFVTTGTWAQNLDAESAAALQQTIALLTDQTQRDALVSGNTAAANADQAVRELANGDEKQSAAVYALSSSVMTAIVTSANGDLNQMNAIMVELQNNPAAIAKYLSPQDMLELQQLAEQLEAL